MSKFNKANEIVKHKYFEHLREAQGRSEKTIDCVRTAIMRFEKYCSFAN